MAEVLDEGEGLGYLGHDGVEEPVDVGADIGHGLRTIFILRFCGSPGLEFDNFLDDLMLGFVWLPRANCTTWHWMYRCTEVPHHGPQLDFMVHRGTSWSTGGHHGPQGDIVVSTKPHH